MKYQVAEVMELPFDDDSRDVIFANFMLYHVTDLQQGLRELRRVLRPGGLLFAMTNGEEHMAQLHDLVSLYDGGTQVMWDRASQFRLQNGRDVLQPLFDEVERIDYDSALEVTEVEPLIDYIASMNSLGGQRSVFVGQHGDAIRQRVRDAIEQHGSYRIDKQSGLFVAR